jgi:hypothetical protein
MNTSPKNKALLEMSRLAARHGILYLVIEDELIETYAEDAELKLDSVTMMEIKEAVLDALQQDVEGHIETAVDDMVGN